MRNLLEKKQLIHMLFRIRNFWKIMKVNLRSSDPTPEIKNINFINMHLKNMKY